MFYQRVYVTINGSLQVEMASVNMWVGLEKGKQKTRVTVSWAMPDSGLEFDPRPHLGTDHLFHISLISTVAMPEPTPEFVEHCPTVFSMAGKVSSMSIVGESVEAQIQCVFESVEADLSS